MKKKLRTSSEYQDYVLWVLLLQTRRALLKLRQKELAPFEITGSQAFILYIVDTLGNNVTPAEISRFVFRKPHSVSEILTRMEKQGLISKNKDLDKKHQVRIAITAKGRRVHSHSMKMVSVQKVMSCLSENEREMLRLCLEKLRRNAAKELEIDLESLFPAT